MAGMKETDQAQLKSAKLNQELNLGLTKLTSRSNLALYLGTLFLMIIIGGGLAAGGYFALPFLLAGAGLTAIVLGTGGILLGLTLGMITAALTRNTEDFSFGASLSSEIERDIENAAARDLELDTDPLYAAYDTDRRVFFSSQKMLSYVIIGLGMGLGVTAGLLFNIALPAVFVFAGPLGSFLVAGAIGLIVGATFISESQPSGYI